jgi:hypothetical protein
MLKRRWRQSAMSNKRKTPEQCVKSYLKAWEKQQINRAFEFCQLTWKHTSAISGRDWLKNFFNGCRLVSFELLNVIYPMNNKVVADAEIRCVCKYYRYNKTTQKTEFQFEKTIKIKIRLIKESRPYAPSEDGQWGVNPISTLKTEEDNG